MDLGGSGDLRVLVRRFMWVVLGDVIIVVIVFSVAVGPVIHEPKTRPSLSRAQLREVTPTSWEPPNRFSVVVVSATGGQRPGHQPIRSDSNPAVI